MRYVENSQGSYRLRAAETIVPSLYPDDQEPLAVDLTGTCPRCGHAMVPLRRWFVVISPATKLNERERRKLTAELRAAGVDLSQGDESFELTCSCEEGHARRPIDRKGCGASFDVRVVWP